MSGAHLYSGNDVKDINNGADNTFLIHKTDHTAIIVNYAGSVIKTLPACNNKIAYRNLHEVWCLNKHGYVFKFINNVWEYKYYGPYRDISVDMAHPGLLFFCKTAGYYINYIWTFSGASGSYIGGC